MALQVKNGLQLTAPPEGATIKMVVADQETGQYHTTDVPTGGESAQAVTREGNFSFAVLEDQVIEYITFKKIGSTLNIRIGTTSGGNEILEAAVDNPGPLALNYYVQQSGNIYVTGVAAGTVTKIKIS